jgi:invasin-like protein
LLTDNGDVIYYKLMGDGKRLIKLQDSVHIREGELVNGRWLSRSVDGLGQAVVLTGGSQSVTFELVYDRGTTYTLSHLTDNLNAYINPNSTGGLSHGLLVSVNPDSFPADDVTDGRVTVQLVDSQGRWVQEMGRTVNLTSSRGNLSVAQLVTNAHGSGSAMLTSGELGLGVVTAQSQGLHDGTGEVAFTLPPLVIEFDEWILSSEGTGPGRELVAQFHLAHNTSYSVTLTGWDTEAHWLLMPEEWAIGRIEIDGLILDEI